MTVIKYWLKPNEINLLNKLVEPENRWLFIRLEHPKCLICNKILVDEDCHNHGKKHYEEKKHLEPFL